jgi:hypothetical protein
MIKQLGIDYIDRMVAAQDRRDRAAAVRQAVMDRALDALAQKPGDKK